MLTSLVVSTQASHSLFVRAVRICCVVHPLVSRYSSCFFGSFALSWLPVQHRHPYWHMLHIYAYMHACMQATYLRCMHGYVCVMFCVLSECAFVCACECTCVMRASVRACVRVRVSMRARVRLYARVYACAMRASERACERVCVCVCLFVPFLACVCVCVCACVCACIPACMHVHDAACVCAYATLSVRLTFGGCQIHTNLSALS